MINEYNLDKTINGFAPLGIFGDYGVEKNGGKGSGNFGHSGRPGEVGGSSRSATTSARLARKDALAEAFKKKEDLYERVRGMEREGIRSGEEYEKLTKDLSDKIAETRTLEDEDFNLTQKEIQRGMEKKQKKDTPGKKETAKALEELKKAQDEYREIGKKQSDVYLKGNFDSEKAKKVDAEMEKIGKKLDGAYTKYNEALAYQMVNDKQFNDDLQQHIEEGLGIKLKNFKLKEEKSKKDDQTSVSASTELKGKDLGALAKTMQQAGIYYNSNMSRMYASDGMSGRATIYWKYRSGGENGHTIFSTNYAPDGSYWIRDDR